VDVIGPTGQYGPPVLKPAGVAPHTGTGRYGIMTYRSAMDSTFVHLTTWAPNTSYVTRYVKMAVRSTRPHQCTGIVRVQTERSVHAVNKVSDLHPFWENKYGLKYGN